MTNLFISDELKQITIEDDNWIKIPVELNVETIDKISNEFKKMQEGEHSHFIAMAKAVLFLIKEWNFKKGDKQMPVNFENVSQLRFKFLQIIFDTIIQNCEDLQEIMGQAEEVINKKKADTAS
jgi:hypothetical protein